MQLKTVEICYTLSPLSINKLNNFRFWHSTMYQIISKFAAYTKKENAVAKRCSLCHIWIIQISRVVLYVNCRTRKLMKKGKKF